MNKNLAAFATLAAIASTTPDISHPGRGAIARVTSSTPPRDRAPRINTTAARNEQRAKRKARRVARKRTGFR